MASALTDLTEAKQYLKVAVNTDDDLIQGLINACSTAIENYCRRIFLNQSYSEFYDGNQTRYINLKNYPVSAITQVQVNGVTLDKSSYLVKNDTGVLTRVGPYPNGFTGVSTSRFNTIWNRGDYNIKVDYTAGYTTIPDDVELACKMFVASIYKADVANFSTTFNEGFVFKADAIPVQVKLMLQPYVDTSGGVN
jgi:uncharacterized phiE125 gp8 family phage protein